MTKINSVVLGIWSVSALTALPGLAISPIMGDLQTIFPKAGEMEIQMLTSLPSLLIIPFIIISGYLTQKVTIYKLLVAGLILFGATGIFYLLATKMWQLILVSALLGIGAGMIIPLSTGLIALFFTGKERTMQFGLNSSISNFMIVVATFLTGYLAGVSWRLPFLVYLLPFVALFFVVRLKKYRSEINSVPNNKMAAAANPAMVSAAPSVTTSVTPSADISVTTSATPSADSSVNHNIGRYGLDIAHLLHMMAFYWMITFLAVIIVFYVPFLMTSNGMSEKMSGTIISLFFLAIMLPGLFLNKVLDTLGRQTVIFAIAMITVGLFIISVTNREWMMLVAAIITGIGYGIAQPLCYDKTGSISLPTKNTVALAGVMTMNYLAIVLCPFIIDGLKNVIDIQENVFPFRLGTSLALLLLSLALFKNRAFIFTVSR
ncbi:MAG: MFS transporter [Bacteroidales bacterium]